MRVKIDSGKNKIAAFIHGNKRRDSNKLAILLPGFLDSKDYPHLTALGQELSALGFTAVRFDPTGIWESGGKTKNYTVTQYLKDIDEVVSFMRKQNKKKYDKTIILGHSLGGMMAILYGVYNQDINAVIGTMPPSSQISPKDFQETLKEWQKEKIKVSYRVLPDDESKKKKYEVPYSYIEDSRKYDVRRVVSSFKKPLLLIAGELDDKISPQEIKEIFKRANQPKKFIILKGVKHDYRLNKKEIKTVNDCIEGFLKEYGFC